MDDAGRGARSGNVASALAQLRVLEGVIAAVTEASAVDAVCERLLEATLAPLGFTGGAIYLIDPDGEHVSVAGVQGADAAFLAAFGRLSLRGEPQAAVLRRGGGLFIEDRDLFPPLAAVQMRYHSGAAVPLVAHGSILGMVALGADEVREFPPDERKLLLDVGRLAGVVMSRFTALGELRESRERYAAWFDNAQVGIYRARASDGALVEANARLASMFGFTTGDVSAAPPAAHAHHGVDAQRLAGLETREKGGPPVVRDVEMRRKDGTAVWVHLESRLTPDGDYVDGIMVDVTAQHQAAAALAESEQRFRRLAENSPAIIYRYRLDPPGFEYVSPAATAVTGYTPEDHYADSQLGTKLVHPDDRHLLYAVARGEADPSAPLTLRWVRKDGAEIWTEQRNAAVAGPDGRAVAIEGIAFDVSDRHRAEESLADATARLTAALEGVMDAMGSIVELRDPYTAGHQRRVAELAVAIAARMGLPEEAQRGLRLAGSVHDIGQLAVPTEILAKPGRLPAAEMDLVRQHATAGRQILERILFDWPVADVVCQHHERLDGSGYPAGLRDDEILLEARILAVADVVEAMSSHRPYRPALGVPAALAEIADGAGRVYDADVVAACESVFAEGFEFAD